MASRLTELCETLVEKNYGYPAAQIFRSLAHQGRLNLFQLHQHSGLPMKRVKAVIVILIKHNIILWHQADDTELPYYQIDWHAAYVLARQSRVTRLVDSRHGKKSRDILQNIMLLGTVQVGDLEGEYDLDILGSDSKRDSGIESAQAQSSADAGIANGFPDVEGCFVDDKDDGTITTAASFHNTLRSLLEEGFLMKINLDRDHVPAADLEDHLRNEVVSANSRDFPGGKITGPKTAEKFAVAANLLKRKWQAEAEYSSQRDVASQGSIKRGHSGKTHSNKRRKVNGNLTNGEYHDHADEMSENEEELPAAAPLRRLPHDMCVRVNFHKCMIALRTERLQKLAEEYLGPVTAAVYGAALHAAEGKIHSVRSPMRVRGELLEDEDGEEIDDPGIVTVLDHELLWYLDRSIDLASTIEGAASQANGMNGHHKKPRMVLDDDEDIAAAGIKREHYSDDEDDAPLTNGELSVQQRQKRLNLISMHLDLLGSHAKEFLFRNTNKRTSSISFAPLSKTLVAAEIDSMVRAKCGKIGVRVVRLLREKGRLQDTQIATLCLKRIKDLRAVLTDLQTHGILEIQELPREASRQPSRTTYLWHFAEHSVREMYLQQSYHGLTRALQRIDYERERYRGVIEKAESVRGKEAVKLNDNERKLLREWRGREERLLVAAMRLDDVVLVLRDFGEGDTSLTT